MSRTVVVLLLIAFALLGITGLRFAAPPTWTDVECVALGGGVGLACGAAALVLWAVVREAGGGGEG